MLFLGGAERKADRNADTLSRGGPFASTVLFLMAPPFLDPPLNCQPPEKMRDAFGFLLGIALPGKI
ncbi:hypothetical protein WOA01_04330 [Methylocystis sp. IM2]|uniref:hypothetical protein n=1 Tax=unclassified Methylocystis TaxID=2625913 RepID=UPI0030F6EAC6